MCRFLSCFEIFPFHCPTIVSSSAFYMYQQTLENNIYRSKLRKSILCACICIAYMKSGIACDEKYLLDYFEISEKNHSLGDKKVKLAVPESRS